MKVRILSAAVVALLSNVAFADTFQAEAGLQFTNTDADFLAKDIDTFSVGGTIYLKPVSDAKGPLLEAAFLDKASGLSASYSNPDSPIDEFYTLDGRFVTNGNMIIEAGYSDAFNDDTYRVGLGTYLSDTAEVLVSYTRSVDSDVDTLAAEYHGVAKLAGTASVAYTLSAGYVDAWDSGYVVSGEATYYVNPKLGIGAVASISDYNNTDITSVGIQASYFVTPTFYVQGFARTADYDGPDEDTLGIGASFRF